MGHKAAFMKNRRDATARQRDRSAQGRPKQYLAPNRRDDAAAVQRVAVTTARVRTLPEGASKEMLVGQADQAARIPGAAEELRALLRGPRGAEESKKRGRDDDDNDAAAAATGDAAVCSAVYARLEATLPALAVDEVAAPVVAQLIRSAAASSAELTEAVGDAAAGTAVAEAAVSRLILAFDAAAAAREEREAADEVEELEPATNAEVDVLRLANVNSVDELAQHFAGRSVVWAMVECGTYSQQKKLNKRISGYALQLATHRHGAHTLLRLLEHYPKSRLTIAPALAPVLADLVQDANGIQMALGLVGAETAAEVAQAVLPELETLVSTKRGGRFVVSLLDTVPEVEGKAALHAAIEKLLPLLPPMVTDARGNFVAQAAVRAVVRLGDAPLVKRVVAAVLESPLGLDKKGPASVADLATHHIATHVLAAVAAAGGEPARALSAALHPHVVQLVGHKHGSLALRRLVEGATSDVARRNVADALLTALGQHVPQFMTHEYGNLVLQAVLKGTDVKGRATFFSRHVRPELLTLAQHEYGSRVVDALLGDGMLDSKTFNDAFGTLKPKLLALAQHVNARFIVARLLQSQREARVAVLEAAPALLRAKGAHHVLVAAYTQADPAQKKKLTTLIGGQLLELATDQNASMSIQKLMQADAEAAGSSAPAAVSVLAVVRSHVGTLAKRSAAQQQLDQQMKQSFFGRYVAQLAERL